MSSPFSTRKRYPLDVEAWVQFKLLRLAAHHPDTRKADLAVLAEVIQRYHGKFGNGFVSDAEICSLTGLCDRTVGRSRERLTRLGFVAVVRSGGRGHATVYTPNFGLVPQKGDTDVTHIKGDTWVHETDPSVTLNAVKGDTAVTPSYLLSGLQAETQIDRLDSAPPTAPAGAGPTAAPPGAAEEDLSVHALIRAYVPSDMSKPARAAYKRAWEAIPAGTDLAMVIARAADWHQAWAQQNDPNAPRKGLMTWLKDELWLKPPPGGFNRPERPAKPKAGKPKPASPKLTAAMARKPASPITARITTSEVVKIGGTMELRFTTDATGAEKHIVVLEANSPSMQEAGQRDLRNLLSAAGIEDCNDSSDLHGRTIVLGGVRRFEPPDVQPADWSAG